MPFFITGEHSDFPSVELADQDGLLAIGGKFTFERLIDAYKKGIFRGTMLMSLYVGTVQIPGLFYFLRI
ncbi:MAG TPA: hypothetical protein VGP55_06340 [Chitinophagaceae bacterium]|nr:hypothetical protein [Chitinophagaceae bacterium]